MDQDHAAGEQDGTSSSSEILPLLQRWEYCVDHNNDPQPILTQMAELIERETEIFLKMDPDPFDDRHPSRVDPNCGLGQALKILFRKDIFMTKLVNDYMRDSYYSRQHQGTSGDQRAFELNVAACRLMLDILPGLDTSAVFQLDNESLINRMYGWAENSAEPLQSYATGLLAAAMEVSDIAANFREHNNRLVPLMLKRLHALQAEAKEEGAAIQRPFAHLGQNSPLKGSLATISEDASSPPHKKRAMSHPPEHIPLVRRPARFMTMQCMRLAAAAQENGSDGTPSMSKPSSIPSPQMSSPTKAATAATPTGLDSGALTPSPVGIISSRSLSTHNDCSNSSWAEMESFVIGSFQLYPPTLPTKQILILRYLTPVGEYQEFLGHVFEHNALDLILKYTNMKESRDARLAFEALKYLGALMCHKKFSFEFISSCNLQHLMDIRRPSLASCGVAMCLYHMAYCSDTMERICLLPHYIIQQIVRYSLWLLECSHDSSRCHAVMFFIHALPFQVILEEFDLQDGLRKVYNVVSTQPLVAADDNRNLNEDEQCAARQIIRHSFMCFKRYFETHLCVRADQYRRACVRDMNPNMMGDGMQQPPPTTPAYKPLRPSQAEVQGSVDMLLEMMSVRTVWPPVDDFIKLGGIALLLKVIAYAYEWNYSGRAETVRNALDSLSVCVVMPRAQLQLCESVELPFDSISMGMNIILGAAEGEIVADADVQRSALNVIGNCVCAPEWLLGGNVASLIGNSPRKKAVLQNSHEVIDRMWDSVRTNNGIMVLLQLMTAKTRLTEADSIRMLACRALSGLARSETVRQIIGKLPLFTEGQLQLLMRDPILQDRRQEHAQFQKYAVQLLERVTGKPGCKGNELEASLAHIHKSNVVAQTKISFNEQQLNQLILEHLMKQGFKKTASKLRQEAGLPELPTSPEQTERPIPVSVMFPFSHRGSPVPISTTPVRPRSVLRCATASPLPSTTSRLTDAGLRLTPISGVRRQELPMWRPDIPLTSRALEKQTRYESSVGSSQIQPESNSKVTLDGIVTSYLKNQHALCNNPVMNCPEFNLLMPHKCPDYKNGNRTSVNFAMRLSSRQTVAPRGIGGGSRLDRRLVHSRFCPVKTFRNTEEETFTCLSFDPQENRMMLGTFEGQLKLFNIYTGLEEASYNCHESYVYRIETSRTGRLLLTSSTWRRPLSALFTMTDVFERKYPFPEEEYVEFSKVSQNMVLGTKRETASIYDVETGRKIVTLRPELSNSYTKNRATFSPSDELVLSDGVLWDVKCSRHIHKFDKLNQTLSGIFHPNGVEVVSNTEVWDIRTFHLLRTVPALDQCEVRFTPTGDVIYSFSMEAESDEEASFESSFKTLDALDYSSIATIDVKRNIYDLAVNPVGSMIAIVENQGLFERVQESCVRLYDIGRRRVDEDEGEEEEEEDTLLDKSSSSSSGDDDDNASHDVFDFDEPAGGGDAADEAGGEAGDEDNAGGEQQEDEQDSDSDSVFSMSGDSNSGWETTSYHSGSSSSSSSDATDSDDEREGGGGGGTVFRNFVSNG